MGKKYINVYMCRACGYIKATYLSVKNHIWLKHPEVWGDYKNYISLVFKIPSKEYQRRILLYLVAKYDKKNFKKPNWSLRLVV